MKLSELRTWFYNLAGVPTDDNRFISSTVNTLLNIANQQWCSRTNALETSDEITIAEDTPNYDLPDDFVRQVRVIFDGKPLQFKDVRHRVDYDATASGVPEAYWTWGDQVYLYPTPSEVASCILHYIGSPTDMGEDDDDTPGWNPASYHKALVFYALYLAKGSEGNESTAKFWLEQFEAQVLEYQTYKLQPTLAQGQAPGLVPQGRSK